MNFDEMLQAIVQDMINEIKVILPCEITKINQAKTIATVKPLFKSEGNSGVSVPYPLIPDVPINMQYGGGYFVRIPFKKGDLVSVVFGAHEMSSALKGFSVTESDETFSLSNAMIIAGLPPTLTDIPTSWQTGDNLLVGSKDAYLEFTQTDVLAVVNNLKYSLSTHQHPGPMTPPNPTV